MFATAGTAGAHESTESVRVTLDPLPGELTGVRVALVVSVAEQLVLSNPTDHALEVLDEHGTPFLRIGPTGVEANRAAAAWYRTNHPFGGTAVPESATDPAAPADWAQVAVEPSWGWFDHRLHPGGVAPSAEILQRGEPTELAQWSVPVRYRGSVVELTGAIEFRPARGRVEAVLDSAPDVDGLQIGLLPGRVPGLFLDNGTDVTVEVLGAEGEPFLRVTPQRVEANVRSPSWAAASRVGGELLRHPVDATAPPEWAVAADVPRLGWVEPRAAYPDAEPPEEIVRQGVSVTLMHWVVPLRVDGQEAALEGRTVWTPLAASTPSRGLPVRPLVAGAAVVLLLALAVRGRGRAGDGPPATTPGPPPGGRAAP